MNKVWQVEVRVVKDEEEELEVVWVVNPLSLLDRDLAKGNDWLSDILPPSFVVRV